MLLLFLIALALALSFVFILVCLIFCFYSTEEVEVEEVILLHEEENCLFEEVCEMLECKNSFECDLSQSNKKTLSLRECKLTLLENIEFYKSVKEKFIEHQKLLLELSDLSLQNEKILII